MSCRRRRTRLSRELIFSGVSDPESQWKAQVAAGVFAARGFSLTWIIDGSGRMRYNRVTGRFAVASRRQVVRAIERAAQTANVRLDSVELLHPLTYAPVVTITVPDRARFEKQGGLHLQALLNYARPRVEGIFLIARDSHGRIWSRGGTAIRLGTGAGNWAGSTHG